MAKIFISFYNAIQDDTNPLAMPCFYDSLIQELKNNGNEIKFFFSSEYYTFGESFKNAEAKVDLTATIKKIKEFNPDFIIAFNHSYLDISQHFDCPIVIWEVDSFQMYADKDRIRKNIGKYTFFAGSTKTCRETKDFFKTKDVHYFPFTTAIRREDKEKNTNISLIGTYFGSQQLANIFMEKNPSHDEIQQFKALLLFTANNPEQSLPEAYSELGIQSEKIRNLANSNYEYIQYTSMNKRLGIISEIADLGLKIYGSRSWIQKPVNDPNVVLSYMPEVVYSLKHNQDIYNSSKIAININHTQVTTGFSLRVADIMASSACLVTDVRSDFKVLFPEIEFFSYGNKFEAREICKKLLSEENLRYDYSRLCNEIIDKRYRIHHTLKKAEEVLNIKLIDLESAGSASKFSAVELSNTKVIVNRTKGRIKRVLRRIIG